MPRRPTMEFRRHKEGETLLRRAQRAIVQADANLSIRDNMLSVLYERGYTQRQLVEILNEETAKSGQAPMTEDAVQKAIRRALK